MTKKEKVALIKKSLQARENVFLQFRKLEKLVGCFADDSPLCRALCNVINSMLFAVSAAIGDRDNPTIGTNLEWFVYENDCGAKALQVEIDGKKRKIKTIEDLLWVVDNLN